MDDVTRGHFPTTRSRHGFIFPIGFSSDQRHGGSSFTITLVSCDHHEDVTNHATCSFFKRCSVVQAEADPNLRCLVRKRVLKKFLISIVQTIAELSMCENMKVVGFKHFLTYCMHLQWKYKDINMPLNPVRQ